MTPSLIIDGHLDIAMNAVDRNRDQLQSVETIRAREKDVYLSRLGDRRLIPKGRGVNTVSLQTMRHGNVGLTFGNLGARIAHETNDHQGFACQDLCLAAARGQLAYYDLLCDRGDLRYIRDRTSLREHIAAWTAAIDQPVDERPPVGLVLSMEGADPILGPDHVIDWYNRGLRMLSLAHYGKSTYANGTGCTGGLTDQGASLLAAMADVGMVLDLTHLADQAFWEAIDTYDGSVLASHCNARALVPGQRQLDDDQLQAIIDRDGVIGVALDVWMLQPGWTKGIYNEVTVTLDALVDHIDHICSLADDTTHVAMGTDLDGGYGKEQVPRDLDTIADLQRIPGMLEERGYSSAEIDDIMHGNWVRLLDTAWAA